MKLKTITLMLLTFSSNSFAFDLEDYAGTMRATRDAMIKAQNELALASDAFFGYRKLLISNCYVLSNEVDIKNLDGLMTGACNRDGETPHTYGGVKKASGVRLGDRISRMIKLTPFMSPKSFSADNNMTTLRALRDTQIQDGVDAQLAKGLTITFNSSCTPKNDAIIKAVTAGLDFEDVMSTYRARRDAFLKAADELLLATAPYKAAMEAYKAATAVFVKNSKCESGAGRKNLALYDPYIPDPDHVF
jgi:hypothetical protein